MCFQVWRELQYKRLQDHLLWPTLSHRQQPSLQPWTWPQLRFVIITLLKNPLTLCTDWWIDLEYSAITFPKNSWSKKTVVGVFQWIFQMHFKSGLKTCERSEVIRWKLRTDSNVFWSWPPCTDLKCGLLVKAFLFTWLNAVTFQDWLDSRTFTWMDGVFIVPPFLCNQIFTETFSFKTTSSSLWNPFIMTAIQGVSPSSGFKLPLSAAPAPQHSALLDPRSLWVFILSH